MKRLILLLLPLWLTACFSPTLVTPLPNVKLEQTFVERQNQSAIDFEPNSFLRPEAVIFFISNDPDTPKTLQRNLSKALEITLSRTKLLPKLLPEAKTSLLVDQNRETRTMVNTYLESLTFVGVSNRDLALPISKILETQSFVVLIVDQWPCEACETERMIRFKLSYIDAHEGEIVWTCVAERSLMDSELTEKTRISMEMIQTLTQKFEDHFKTRWHRTRYQHLKESI